ncbi:MAG: iron ABC transporter permease [Myxococcota bacterium]
MTWRIVLLVALSGLVVVVAPFIGPPVRSEALAFVLAELRIPRVLVGALVGACLGAVGAGYQALFGNPLATPSTTGTTAGAALGALFAFVVLPVAWTASSWVVVGCAFAGALLVAGPVAALALRGEARIESVLLAGVAATLAASAITTGLQVQADLTATFRAVRWSLGSLEQVGYAGVLALTATTVLTLSVVLGRTRALQSLVLGEASAHAQGVDVTAVRRDVLVGGAFGVAACVAWCGPIAFVGLVVPHLVRLGVGPSRRVGIPLSAVAGAGFLVACDTVARTAFPEVVVPVGVITSAIGAPLLMGLVLRKSHAV